MKITAALSLTSIGLVSAFVGGPSPERSSSSLGSSDPSRGNKATMEVRDVRDVVSGPDVLDTRVPPPSGFGNAAPMPVADDGPAASRKAPSMSQAIPFVKCPPALDGSLAGDVGFDPLGFADSFENLANYREAEVKHARLAMLAAAGWPLSELWDARIAGVLGMDPALNADGRVPSVLNGGMGRISPTYWLGCLAFAAAVDVYSSFFADKKKEGYVPGDLGFDPLGFYPRSASFKDRKSRERLQLSEIKHGRLAMLAITAFAAQEFMSHTAVVDQTSVFFRPIWDVLGEQQPQYYIPPESVGEGIAAVAPEMTAASEGGASAAAEAATVLPEIAAPAAAEAAAAAPEFVFPDAQEATAAIPPAEAAAATAEELDAARARIAELEEKLARIDALTR